MGSILMNSLNKYNKRIEYIDIAKGMAILCIII